VTQEQIHEEFRRALGDGPAADFFTAQVMLETGGGRGAYGYNLGNMKPSDKHQGKYQILKTWEETPEGARVDMREPFYAYDSLAEGVQAYLEYQDRKGHLDAADSGDLREFNRSLKSKGYYTAKEDAYLRNLERRLRAVRGGRE
jgi:flagellum-specific peptidoglycan hydrolase FlgJ